MDRSDAAALILERADQRWIQPQTIDISGLDLGAQPVVDFFTYFEKFTEAFLGQGFFHGPTASALADELAAANYSEDFPTFFPRPDGLRLVYWALDTQSLYLDPHVEEDAPLYTPHGAYDDDGEMFLTYLDTGKTLWGWLGELAGVLQANPDMRIDDDWGTGELGPLGRRILWFRGPGEALHDYLSAQDVVDAVLGRGDIATQLPVVTRPGWLSRGFRETGIAGSLVVLEALLILRRNHGDHSTRNFVEGAIGEVLASRSLREDERCAEFRIELSS